MTPTFVADFLEAEMAPTVPSSCLKMGMLTAAEAARPLKLKPNTLGKAIIVMMLPKGNTPCGGATSMYGLFSMTGSAYATLNEK